MFVKQVSVVYKILKQYSTATCIYKKELKISPFCNLAAKVPFNIKIRPLDVHLYPNCDRLIVQLFSNDPKSSANIECIQNDDHTSLTAQTTDENINCLIETSVKSNLNITTTQKGHINVKNINGDEIILRSEAGDIQSEKCQCSVIQFTSECGNISCLGTLHAADIYVHTKKFGEININHMQGLRARIVSEDGDIKIKSSYNDRTEIQSHLGNLALENTHKDCLINSNCRAVQMVGFDGSLTANFKHGNVDVQLSKLTGTSKIQMKEEGNITLRLSEWVQQNTQLNVSCSNLSVADNLKFLLNENDGCHILANANKTCDSKLLLASRFSTVHLESASWSEMLKLKGIHLSD